MDTERLLRKYEKWNLVACYHEAYISTCSYLLKKIIRQNKKKVKNVYNKYSNICCCDIMNSAAHFNEYTVDQVCKNCLKNSMIHKVEEIRGETHVSLITRFLNLINLYQMVPPPKTSRHQL